MHFSSIPDGIFLQIFAYLPFEDRVKLGRVNRAFRLISQCAISKTKFLAFIEVSNPRTFTPEAVAASLSLCWKNLEEIQFCRWSHETNSVELSLVKKFLEFQCPRLRKFTCTKIGNDRAATVGKLLENNPNLGSIVIDDYFSIPKTDDKVCLLGRLESLHCWWSEHLPHAFRLLLLAGGRATPPKLKHLRLKGDFWFSLQSLDQFLGAVVPNLESLGIITFDGGCLKPDTFLNSGSLSSSSFWSLKRLTTLEIGQYIQTLEDGDTLSKIVRYFPRLRVLKLPVTSEVISENGARALSELRDLAELRLHALRGVYTRDRHIAHLSRCERLRKLRLGGGDVGCLSAEGLRDLLRSCPELGWIELWGDLSGAESRDQIVDMLRSFGGVRGGGGGGSTDEGKPKRRTIAITFRRNSTSERRTTWESDEVKEALNTLEREHGVEMKIFWKQI